MSVAIRILKLFDLRERVRLALLVTMMVIGAGLEVAGIGFILPFIGVISNPSLVIGNRYLAALYGASPVSSTREFMVMLGVVLLVFYLVKNLFLGYLASLQARFVFTKHTSLSRQLLEAYLSKPYWHYFNHNTADMLKTLTGEVSGVTHGVILPSLTLLAESLVVACVVVLLIVIDPIIALVTVFVMTLIAFAIYRILQPALKTYGQERSLHMGAVMKAANQALGSVKEIKVFGRERYFIEVYNKSVAGFATASQMFSTLNAVPRLAIETMAVIGLLTTVLVVLGRESDARTVVPVLALFVMAAIRLMPSFGRIFAALNSLRFYLPALDTVAGDLRNVVEVTALAPAADRSNTLQDGVGGTFSVIGIQDLWFRYPGAADWALRGVSLSIQRGASLALVGPSGAGKSTLVDIILGLLQPERGTVRVDEAELRDVIPRWRRAVGYVPQAIYLLDDTLRRNVAFGIPDSEIDDARVWRVLCLASLEERAGALPQGLDTPVGERGARLSGGERQRVGIARALYHDPEVIVFDEATSSLDATTEQTIAQALDQLAGSKTVIVIAHRLSTVQHCERLVFMKNGAIAAMGGFSELVASSAEFAGLVRDQTLFVA